MALNWQERLENLKLVHFVRATSKKLILPGFDKMPLFDVANFFFRGLLKGSVNLRAAALSFNLFFAIFPAILVFFSLIPYVPIPDFQETLMETIARLVPENAFLAIQSTIEEIILQKNGGVLSISFILVVFISMNVVNSIIVAFNQSYHQIDSRSFIKQRMISAFLILIINILIIISVLLITIGKESILFLQSKSLINAQISVYLFMIGRWFGILIAVYFGFSSIYYLAPTKRTRYKFFSAGSSFATFLFILAAFGFKMYVNNFALYNVLYGSIGTLIIVMIWMYINSIVLILGFELNASISSAKRFANISPNSNTEI